MQRPVQAIDFSQSNIIRNVNKFLNDTIGRDTNVKFTEEGVCSGLTAKYLSCMADGTEQEFFRNLSILATLTPADYQKNSAAANKYIQEVITIENPREFGKSYDQSDLDKIFPNTKTKLDGGVGVVWPNERFAELLGQVVQEGRVNYVVINEHAIGIVLREGAYHVYDPNSTSFDPSKNSNVVTFKNIDAVAEHLKKEVFMLDDIEPIGIMVKSFSRPPANSLQQIPVYKPLDTNYLASVANNNEEIAEALAFAIKVKDLPLAIELMAGINEENPINLSQALKNCGHYQTLSILDAILEQNKALNFSALTPQDVCAAMNVALRYNDKQIPEKLYANSTNIPGLAEALKKNMERSLTMAAQGGNVENITFIYAQHKGQWTPAQIEGAAIEAAQYGRSNAVNHLMQLANPKFSQDKILKFSQEAIKYGQVSTYHELAKILQANGQKPDPVLVSTAIQYHQPLILKSLLSAGANITNEHMREAIKSGRDSVLNVLLQNVNYSSKPVQEFATEIAQAMKGDSLQIDSFSKDKTPKGKAFLEDLKLFAILNGKTVLERELERRDIVIPPNHANATVELVKACVRGDVQLVQKLVKQDLNLNISTASNPRSLIDIAQNHPEVLTILIKNMKLTAPQIDQLFVIAYVDGNHSQMREAFQQKGYLSQLSFDPLSQHYDKFSRDADLALELIEKGVKPSKEYIQMLLANGETPFLDNVLKRVPDVKAIFTPAEVIQQMNAAFANNDGTKFAYALKFCDGQPPQMKQVLNLMMKQATADPQPNHLIINELLKNGAEFPSTANFRQVMYAAYNIKEPVNGNYDIKVIREKAKSMGHEEVFKLAEKAAPILQPVSKDGLAKAPAAQPPARPNRVQLFTVSPLMEACQKGDLAFVKTLTTDKLALHSDRETILFEAVKNGHKEIVAHLVGALPQQVFENSIQNMLREKNPNWKCIAVLLETITRDDVDKISGPVKKQLVEKKDFIHQAFLEIVRSKKDIDSGAQRMEIAKLSTGMSVFTPATPQVQTSVREPPPRPPRP